MDKIIDRLSASEIFLQSIKCVLMYADGCGKFHKTEGKHIVDAHVADRCGTQIGKLDTKKRSAHDVTVTAVLHKKLDPCNNVLKLLNLIQKDNGFSFFQWRRSDKAQPHEKFLCNFGTRKKLNQFRLLDKIKFNIRYTAFLETFTDQIGFANLSCTGKEKSVFSV